MMAKGKVKIDIVIYKFPVRNVGETILELPRFSNILHFGFQDGKYYVWVQMSSNPTNETRRLKCFGTGVTPEQVAGHLTYIGTVINPENHNVWHCFEEVPW